MNDWQPAIIVDKATLQLKHPKGDCFNVYIYAGRRIRVRIGNELDQALVGPKFRDAYGCQGEILEVHPDDVEKTWPGFTEGRCGVCSCAVITD